LKERGILFNGEMVRAILDGRKSQTRRIVKPQPEWEGCIDDLEDDPKNYCWKYSDDYETPISLDQILKKYPHCIPHGHPGDHLWHVKWRPSIHMPRWASRINLEITNVRVERVNKITRDDAIAEGIKPYPLMKNEHRQFRRLWFQLYGENSWRDGLWVWVLEFKVVD